MADPDHASLLIGKSTWNEWREENPEISPDLSNLRPRFRYQFEEEAHLGGYNFRDTSFEGADLANMVFYDWELNRTILAGANLRKAHLTGTHLHYVDLSHADLAGADMAFTIIGDTNLSRTKGLADVVHRYPSSIDVDTIEATFRDLKLAARRPTLFSEWGIPSNKQEAVETFLLNSGTPYHLINYYSQTESSMEYCSCFISYSHSDREFATLLWNLHNQKVCSVIPLDLDGFIFGGWKSGKASLIRSRYIADFTGWRVTSAFEKQLSKLERALRIDRSI